ncbi:MAG: 3-oxoadipate enol-lactonase [Hyphomicrobiales bacterium]|nr:MAG: 3-oxoadipate enol-lactonase [Hyphomicrobiales bacterium]
MMITTDDGTELYAELSGADDLPVVMFSNSLGTSLELWDDQMAAFSGRFRILRYDDRGHGRSSAPAGPYTLDRLGRDVIAVLDGLGIDKVDWVGLSKGGMLGMWLATNAPERVGKLVLADTSAHMPTPEMWAERAETAREKGLAAMAPATLERWFTEPFRAANPDVIERIRAIILATSVEGYAGSCEAIGGMDQRETIRAITAPTLVVVGEQDPGTPVSHAEAIVAAIPGARLAVLADAAHLSNVEQAAAFNETVLSFLTA